MQIKLKKLMACVLVVVLGLSVVTHSVRAVDSDELNFAVEIEEQDKETTHDVVKENDTIGVEPLTYVSEPGWVENDKNAEQVNVTKSKTVQSLKTTDSRISTYTTGPEGVDVDVHNNFTAGEHYFWSIVDGTFVLHLVGFRQQMVITTKGQPQHFRIIVDTPHNDASVSLDDCVLINDTDHPAVQVMNHNAWLMFAGNSAVKSKILLRNADYGNEQAQDNGVVQLLGTVMLGGRDEPVDNRLWLLWWGTALFEDSAHNTWANSNGDRAIQARTTTVDVKQTGTNHIAVEAPVLPVLGKWQYSKDGTRWNDTGVFDNLAPDTSYTIHTRRVIDNIEFVRVSDRVVKTLPEPKYEISIPTEMRVEDLSQIKLADDKEFSIPAHSQVNVKMTTKGSVDGEGEITLTRTDGTKTVLTYLEVGGQRFTNMNNNVATFTMAKQDSVELSFEQPMGTGTIPAGTYTGTVVFEISYSD